MDMTESSLVAWRQALQVAEQSGAKIEVLYVQPWVRNAIGLGAPEPVLNVQAGEQALQELRARVGGKAQVFEVTGDADEEIVAWAQKRRADLIVMGTHARTGLDRVLLGSVAEAVVRKSSVPVLVVREYVPKFDSILAPIRAEPYSWEGLNDAGRVAGVLGARLTVLHVFDEPIFGGQMGFEGTRQLLQAMIRQLPPWVQNATKPQVHLAFGNPAEEIVEEGVKHSLVAFVARRKGFLKGRILGSTAERVLRHLPSALLTLPERAPKPAEIARIFRFPRGGRKLHESTERAGVERTERLAGFHNPAVRGGGQVGAPRRGRRAPGRDVESHDLPKSDRGRRRVRRGHAAPHQSRKGRARHVRSPSRR
ncbi:MAG: universal stress protein [Elusimicrobia bacterium]|nr:universal stress protein [Elusimicrobiota bacterium]